MTHPMLPTQEQFAEWDSEYFDGEGQNFDVMMIKAFQAGSDWQLKEVIKWLAENLGIVDEFPRYMWNTCEGECALIDQGKVITDLGKAMRPQEDN